ncbi:MAG: TIGR03364 family FAD-dependent oxidoreductase [Chitinophagaceae bacterium]|nr:TIGR03364 family FAD-dependent oxidoreductase [Chitinophagaceae bacterium]MCW5929198.1 TIGR03364 family FAD-dependent oxidoreductase [Chitinophagaceae bacterium]
MLQKSAIVVGAGIAGLATARALAVRNYRVTVLEKNWQAMSASVRNFGMILPAAQPEGKLYERAKRSLSIWKAICEEAGIWYEQRGSLHLAYAPDEWQVLKEVREIYHPRGYKLLNSSETAALSPAVKAANLMGSLYSKEELIVDPRKAIAGIADWLSEKYGVEFIWGSTVTAVEHPAVFAGGKKLEADEVYICSGADFETLFPEVYKKLPLTKCKLQMMRLAAQPDGWRLGPVLCSPLSLAHYSSYKAAPSFTALKTRIEREYGEYLKYGIHLLVSQNEKGQLTVGDSHEYGLNPDPFNRQLINDMIITYLNTFAQFRETKIIETWNGVYPKLINGDTDIVLTPQNGVTIINGFGGAGMTLAFALSEDIIAGRTH